MPIIINTYSGHKHPFLPSLGRPEVIDSERAQRQDIRPLEVLILNLMADKIGTERQLAKWLGRTPLQVHVTFAATDSYIESIHQGHETTYTPRAHIEEFYKPFKDVRENKFDGIIITGINALEPNIEHEPIWPQVQDILNWSTTNATSSLFLCWGAQAALKHFHGIARQRSSQKTYGVFEHRIVDDTTGILSGFADRFPMPISRWNEICAKDIENSAALELAAHSEEAGVGIIVEPKPFDDGNKFYPYRVYVLNHPEYETTTLAHEYSRDSTQTPAFPLPRNYFPDDNPAKHPVNTWRHTGQFYADWIDLVYKATPYDSAKIPEPFRRTKVSTDTPTKRARSL